MSPADKSTKKDFFSLWVFKPFGPKEFLPFQMDIGIFGNTVLITSVKKEYFTVKIESEEIAHGYRALFEAMWRISKE